MGNHNVRLIGALLVLGLGVGLAAPRLYRWWAAAPAGYCPLCHRHEHKDSLVKFQAEGKEVAEACCLSCVLNYGRQTHKAVTVMSVTDHENGRPLDPDRATFVVGSDLSPCTHLHDTMRVGPQREAYPVRWDRCLPNILAFASPKAAQAFRGLHGGRLRSLGELKRELGAPEGGPAEQEDAGESGAKPGEERGAARSQAAPVGKDRPGWGRSAADMGDD